MNTLYLDMDGVVADFNGWAKKILNTETAIDGRWSKEQWSSLKNSLRMYRDLEKTVEADMLVDFCRHFSEKKKLNLMFLTAVPKGNDVHWAFYDKVLWAQLHYPDIPVMFGPYSVDKHLHCVPGDILIDDRPSNISEWIAAKGIGILHNSNLDQTLFKLAQSK